ncbi:polyprenyl synthetase family protein [Arthrobacter sp. NPDC090010]|uniref:polyprenyl synthetase family protein n=1 Tax=Arthrobacter sp. NPDC090010 TaxID=3363942 RepID=UPI0037FA6CAF
MSALATEQADFVNALNTELDSFLDRQRDLVSGISEDVAPLLDSIATLVSGGKRMRALLAYWGFRAAGGEAGSSAAVQAGVALELFQGAALIHDDIIDRSATRRGRPSVHQAFADRHAVERWQLDPVRFGDAAGILTGDMCLSFSEEAFSAVGTPTAFGTTARTIFNRMRAEVMAGQYLDILEEVAGPQRTVTGAAARARTVLRFKSAKYSTEHPLALGAAIAGAPELLLDELARFSLPLGEAFQLRDDVLGVFGDPDTTGKPAGDDLREGKRTLLVAFLRELGTQEQVALLESRLGQDSITDDDVASIREALLESGALAAVESEITALGTASHAALEELPIPELAREALRQLGESAVKRQA